MNLDQLRAGIAANKKGLAVAGAAAVGGLALMARSKKGGGENTAPAVYNANRSAASTGGQPTAGYPVGYSAPYDSTASDLYNAIQPQIDYLARLAEQQANQKIPVPGPTVADGFYARAGSNTKKGGAIYRVLNGKLEWIPNATSFRQLGGSIDKVKYATEHEDVWKLPKAGAAT